MYAGNSDIDITLFKYIAVSAMAYVIKMGNITINGLIERPNRLNSKPLYV